MQDVRSIIHQAHTENWEELDLSGMNPTELPLLIQQLLHVIDFAAMTNTGDRNQLTFCIN